MNTEANEVLLALLAISTNNYADAVAIDKAAETTRAGSEIKGFIQQYNDGLILFTELLRRILENTVKSPVECYTLQETRAKPLTTQGN